MSIRRFFGQLFSSCFGQRARPPEPRDDGVRIVNAVTGEVIEGHDAVKAHFAREQALHDAYGSSLMFQVYRANLQAATLQELQGEMLAEIKVDGEFVSGADTVAVVTRKVRNLLEGQARSACVTGNLPGFEIEPEDHVTFFFSGRPMRDDTSFYADNYILLPAWVQVVLHRCDFQVVAQRIAQLSGSDQQ